MDEPLKNQKANSSCPANTGLLTRHSGDWRALSGAGAGLWPQPKLPFLTSGPSGLLFQFFRRTEDFIQSGESRKVRLPERLVNTLQESARPHPHGNAAKLQFEGARRRPPACSPAAPTNGHSGILPPFATASSSEPIGEPKEQGA